MASHLSINENALKILRKFIDKGEELGCKVVDSECGASLIDAGIEVPGSIEAGRLIAKISMGGLAAVRIVNVHIGDMTVKGTMVATQEPVIATLGSQLARWRVSYQGYSAMGSGPARAKARIEKNLFDEIGYIDDADNAVLVLETRQYPSEDVLASIADTCHVAPTDLCCILVPTGSIAGFVQIAARIVEIGLYRLYKLGMKPQQFRGGYGVAPFVSERKDDELAMGIGNDCLAYGGRVHFFASPEQGINLDEMAQEACSISSESYGKSFSDLYKEVGYSFYDIDQQLFSPARVSIMDIDAEQVYHGGEINAAMVKMALGHI